MPELGDLKGAGSDYQPPPSEADVTDRGERAFNAQKQQSRFGSSHIDSPDSDADLADDLESCLEDEMIYRQKLRPGFMTRGRLEALINVRTVERELSKLTSVPADRSTRSWAEVICGEAQGSGTYRKIFALLVQVNKVDSIFGFIREEVSDEDLPLMEYTSPEDSPNSPPQLRRKNDATTPVGFISRWKSNSIRTFYGKQWGMVSPFFARGEHRNVRHYQLAEDDILPFTYDSRDEPSASGQSFLERGGFGVVFKVRIHDDHHSFEGKMGFSDRKVSANNPPTLLDSWILTKYLGSLLCGQEALFNT